MMRAHDAAPPGRQLEPVASIFSLVGKITVAVSRRDGSRPAIRISICDTGGGRSVPRSANALLRSADAEQLQAALDAARPLLDAHHTELPTPMLGTVSLGAVSCLGGHVAMQIATRAGRDAVRMVVSRDLQRAECLLTAADARALHELAGRALEALRHRATSEQPEGDMPGWQEEP